MLARRILVPPTTKSRIAGMELPAEIEVDTDGTAHAHYSDGRPDVVGASLADLCQLLGLDQGAMVDWTTVLARRSGE
jgi:hypothetical protein